MTDFEQVETDDGCFTFFAPEVGETFHSKKGAREEAFKKFVHPANIPKLAMDGEIFILDVFFGFGYNTIAAINAARKANPHCTIHIIGLEKSQEVVERIRWIDPPLENYNILKNLRFQEPDRFKVQEGNLYIDVIIGDARETLKTLRQRFDAVFFDPFSPNSQPELWTEEIFSDIKKLMKPGACLTTYSCARIARDSMKKAGFMVKDGPKVGRRGPSTIAIA